jgi:AcrR family transcriptional regulator
MTDSAAALTLQGPDAEAVPIGERFSMAELVRRTGVRPATVRHYLRLGLLPSPHRVAANRFLYDRRHEQAVRLVRLLRERRHLPLAEIRRILPSLAKMPDEQAFRPQMWDEVAETERDLSERRTPAARLLRAGIAAFSRHGFAEVRVDDVCKSAKLAKGSFYRHYRSKEDLFFAAAVAAGDETARAFVDTAGRGSTEDQGPGWSEEEAGDALGAAMTPHLPLMLDLLALAAQRRPGHARVAKTVFADLRRVVRGTLGSPAEGAEHRVVGAALVLGIRHLIDRVDVGQPPLVAAARASS